MTRRHFERRAKRCRRWLLIDRWGGVFGPSSQFSSCSCPTLVPASPKHNISRPRPMSITTIHLCRALQITLLAPRMVVILHESRSTPHTFYPSGKPPAYKDTRLVLLFIISLPDRWEFTSSEG